MSVSVDNNAANGKNFQALLYNSLLGLCVEGKLASIVKNYGLRHPGYSNPEQYYAPFLLTFPQGDSWAIFTTTACRTDRIKGQQWDADHLKQLNTAIKRVYLVYPDNALEKEKIAFRKQQQKYDNLCEFSRIDRILPETEFLNLFNS